MLQDNGWEVVGSAADTRLVQTGNGVLYQEAKDTAIKNLRAYLDPLERRLGEIDQDVDLERYKMPPFKAWASNTELVVARTKKRAAELVGDTLSTFGRYYTPCGGHWWYPFALNEGVWRKAGEDRNPTWEKTLSWEEKKQAARQNTVVDEP